MNRQTILLISDMRQVYLAEIMTKRGLNVRCLDIRNSGTVKEQIVKLKRFLAEAGFELQKDRWLIRYILQADGKKRRRMYIGTCREEYR